MAKDNLVMFSHEFDGVEHLIAKDQFGVDRDFIRPNNIMVISENNTYPVKDCKEVDVQLPEQKAVKLQIAENGEFTPDTYSGEYYDEVTVQMATELTDEEITITENGTYKPSTGKMFSKVTVDVPCDTMVGYDEWGNPAMPYVDPNTGKLEVDDLPDHIKVTVPPTKTAYNLNEYIDYSGIEVRAYTKDDRIWNKQGYTNGIIPYNELILDSIKADSVINSNNGFPESVDYADENYPIDYIAPISDICDLALRDMQDYFCSYGITFIDENDMVGQFKRLLSDHEGMPAAAIFAHGGKSSGAGYLGVIMADFSHPKNGSVLGDYIDIYSEYETYCNYAEIIFDVRSNDVGEIAFVIPTYFSSGDYSLRYKTSYFIGVDTRVYSVGPISPGWYPNRDPFEEYMYGNINATFPINNEYDDISVYVYNVSTNLYCGIDQPIKCSYTGHVIAINNRESIHATYTGNGIFFAFAHNGNETVFVAASERQNDMVTVKVEKNVDGQVTERNENYIWLTREYTYDGRTVYYTYSGFPTSYGTIQTVLPTTTSGQINLFKTYHERIAWAIIYGNKPCGTKKMELPVKWKRPGDRKILETTFEIEIQLPTSV